MFYAIFGEDIPNSFALREAHRLAHLQRISELQDEGRLIMGGPFPAIDSPDPGPAGMSGSLLIVDFPARADAQAWIDADPYVVHGVFARVEVKPFIRVAP